MARWLAVVFLGALLSTRASAQDGLGPEIRIDLGTAVRFEAPPLFAADETWGFVLTSTGARRLGAMTDTEVSLGGIYPRPDARGAVAGERAALAWRGADAVEVALFGREGLVRRRAHPFDGDAVHLDVAASGDDVVIAWTTERAGVSTLHWIAGDGTTVRETPCGGALRRLWCGRAACIASIEAATPTLLAFAVRDETRTARATLGFVPEQAGRRDDAGEYWTLHTASSTSWLRQNVRALAGLVDPLIEGPLPEGMQLVGAQGEQAIALRTTRASTAEVWAGGDPEPLDAYPSLVTATSSGALAIVTREPGHVRFGRWTLREGYVEGASEVIDPSYVAQVALGRELWLAAGIEAEPFGAFFVGLDEEGVIDAVDPDATRGCAAGTAGYACVTEEGRVRLALSGRPPVLTERLGSSSCPWLNVAAQGDGFVAYCDGRVHEIAPDGRERSVVIPGLDVFVTLYTAERDHYALLGSAWRLFVGTRAVAVPPSAGINRVAVGRRVHVAYDRAIRTIDWDGSETGMSLARWTNNLSSLAETRQGFLAVFWEDSGTPTLLRLRGDGTEALGPRLIPPATFDAQPSLSVQCANEDVERCAVVYSYLEEPVGPEARRVLGARWLSSLSDGASCSTDFACTSGWCVSGRCEGEATDGGIATDGGPSDAGLDGSLDGSIEVRDASVDASMPAPAAGCGCSASRSASFFAPALALALLLVLRRARRLGVPRLGVPRLGVPRLGVVGLLALLGCDPVTPPEGDAPAVVAPERDAGLDAACAVMCASACVDLDSDPQHCGACDQPCTADQHCTAGRCACDAGLEVCDGSCVDPSSDPLHCGACGVRCAEGEVCDGGSCTLHCRAGTERCGDRCVDLLTHPAHCGACDSPCSIDEACVSATCVLSCGPRAACDGRCADLASDPLNCGRCGESCGEGAACTLARCTCNEGLETCGLDCVDVDLDPMHCGGCDVACAPGEGCLFGVCGHYDAAWSTLGGSPERTGFNAGERGGPPFTLVARVPRTSSDYFVGMVIGRGRVFVADNHFLGGATFAGFDLADGTERFRREFDRSIGPPTLDGDAVYLHRDLDTFYESRLFRFDLEGVEQWAVPIPASRIEVSVLAVDGRVYVEGLSGSLRAYDAAGVLRFNGPGIARYPGWAASHHEGDVYTFLGGTLRRYDAAGTEYTFPSSLSSGYQETYPALAGGRAYVSSEGSVAAIDLTTERVLWTAPGSGPIMVAGDRVFVWNAGLEAHAIDDGALLWSLPMNGPAPPLATARHLYVPTYGSIEVLDRRSGAFVARIAESGPIAVGEGYLVVAAPTDLSIYRLTP